MSNEQEKINRWFRKHGWNRQAFFNRPHSTRRHFLELVGTGVTASFLQTSQSSSLVVAIPARGGAPQQVTFGGGFAAFESPASADRLYTRLT